MRLARLLGMLNLLANTERTTTAALAKRFEVSQRTILRDLEALDQAGIPVAAIPGPGGGVSLMEGYRVDRSALSRDDLRALFTALSALDSIGGDDGVNELMAKVLAQDGDALFSESCYAVDLSSWFADSDTREKVLALRAAIKERRCVRLDYISKSGRAERTVEPHKLLFKQSAWYLYAYCRTRKEFRLFKLRRVASIAVTEDAFTPRRVARPDYGTPKGASLGPTGAGKPSYDVVLDYRVEDEFRLTDSIDARSFHRARGAECGVITFTVTNLEWAADLAASLLDLVTVRSPAILRDMVRERHNRLFKNH